MNNSATSHIGIYHCDISSTIIVVHDDDNSYLRERHCLCVTVWQGGGGILVSICTHIL